MTPLIIIWTLIAVMLAAGIAWIAVLVRSGARSWHPGDPLPHVPADAPLRTWRRAEIRERAGAAR